MTERQQPRGTWPSRAEDRAVSSALSRRGRGLASSDRAGADPPPEEVAPALEGVVPGSGVEPASGGAGRPLVVNVNRLHVEFQRGGRAVQAVRGVDLQIARGEILGLVGESGSGKTVLGLSLLGLLPVEPPPMIDGSAVVCGVDMVSASAAERRLVRRDHLGAVFQDPDDVAQPDHARRASGGRGGGDRVGVDQAARLRRCAGAAATAPGLSPRAFGGSAPAGDDRHGGSRQPIAGDRRRTHDRPRRHRAGPDPRVAPPPLRREPAARSCSSRTTSVSLPRSPTASPCCTPVGWRRWVPPLTCSNGRRTPTRGVAAIPPHPGGQAGGTAPDLAGRAARPARAPAGLSVRASVRAARRCLRHRAPDAGGGRIPSRAGGLPASRCDGRKRGRPNRAMADGEALDDPGGDADRGRKALHRAQRLPGARAPPGAARCRPGRRGGRVGRPGRRERLRQVDVAADSRRPVEARRRNHRRSGPGPGRRWCSRTPARRLPRG